MKIAVTYENGLVYQHFGHTAAFKIYEAADGKVVSSAVVDTGSSGHSALADLLAQLGADVLICGGIGGCARYALAEAGIQLLGGVSGDADEAVESFLAGTLEYDPNARCNHHGSHHGSGHSCGEHSCSH